VHLWTVRQKRDVPHEAVLDAGSFEVVYLDGWLSDFFYFEDNSGRRLRPDVMTKPEAQRAAQAKARQEQDALDEINFREAVPDRWHYLARALLLHRRGRSTPGRVCQGEAVWAQNETSPIPS
jgi:hypothetical protein